MKSFALAPLLLMSLMSACHNGTSSPQATTPDSNLSQPNTINQEFRIPDNWNGTAAVVNPTALEQIDVDARAEDSGRQNVALGGNVMSESAAQSEIGSADGTFCMARVSDSLAQNEELRFDLNEPRRNQQQHDSRRGAYNTVVLHGHSNADPRKQLELICYRSGGEPSLKEIFGALYNIVQPALN